MFKKQRWPFIYHKGFYQSEKFFISIENVVRNAFVFDESIANMQTMDMMKHIKDDCDSVSIHIRRGDYLLQKHWNTSGSVCQLQYYKNAIDEIYKYVKNPNFYIFSDDLEWVKSNIFIDNATFVDWNKGEDSWQDMMLMKYCRNNIVCNSTFSWWGAWLNENKDKVVIAPDRWFANCDTPDILPEEWIKVSTK